MLDAGTGKLAAASVSFTTGSGSGIQQLTIPTSTLQTTITGNVSGYAGAGTLVQLTGTGTLQVGGTFLRRPRVH